MIWGRVGSITQVVPIKRLTLGMLLIRQVVNRLRPSIFLAVQACMKVTFHHLSRLRSASMIRELSPNFLSEISSHSIRMGPYKRRGLELVSVLMFLGSRRPRLFLNFR